MLATPSGTPGGARPPSSKITRGHSCILCQQRKVKCDKQKPCGNCIKARAECIPSTPTVPRRGRRKFSEQDLAAKLRRYEHLLRKHGVKVEEDDDAPEVEDRQEVSGIQRGLSLDCPRPPKQDQGMLFADNQNSRYVENTLWENLRDEIEDPKEALQTSSDDDINETSMFPDAGVFLLSRGTGTKDLRAHHPPPVQIFRLWQTYLVNVNPLVKIFHAPTIQQTILDATGDLSNVPRATEALMFAIYLISVTSLGASECETMFGESRQTLLSKYSYTAQQALVNAKFLKSVNLHSLQAFSLYLLALRKGYDPQSLWVLTGAAVRLAQRLGIHRDGLDHKFSPFDSEIRRRTWWQIACLDGQSSKLAGAGFPGWLSKFDTELPLNINDSDLSPDMKEVPAEKEGATEMLFCCIRYEVAEALRKSGDFQETKHIKSGPELIAKKDKAIDALKARFEQKYIRYCDPSIPLHLIAIYMSKSVICMMRLMAHHPRQYPDRGASMPQSEKDLIFAESLNALEIAAMGHANTTVQGFHWHIHLHFPLDAFISVLSELRRRTTGDQVDHAWKKVETAFEHRPEMLQETKNSLYYAIGNLTLKAWAKREEGRGFDGREPPRFISVLRSQRNIASPTTPAPTQQTVEWRGDRHPATSTRLVDYTSTTIPVYDIYGLGAQQWKNLDFGYNENMDITPTDWDYWQTLMDETLPTFADDFTWGQQQ